MGTRTAKVLSALVAREGSQTAVWESCGVDSGTFSRYVSGDQRLGANNLRKIIAAYPEVEAPLRAAVRDDRAEDSGYPAEPLKGWLPVQRAARDLLKRATPARAEEVAALLQALAIARWSDVRLKVAPIAVQLRAEAERGGTA